MKLNNKIEIIKRNFINDSRGYLLKVLYGTENGLPNNAGEIYITMANAGENRGGHYHSLATEWFTIIKGVASLRLEDIETKERLEISLNSKEPKTVMVPPNVAHLFCNTSSEEIILLAYSNIPYDSKDTMPYQIDNF